VLKTLVGLGLTRLDSQVYIYLAKRGPQKGQDLSKGLKVQKQQLYRSLKNLQSKGIVNATLEHPAVFNAVSFDKVVDIFIKAKMAEAQRIQENKDEILANWQAISIGEGVDATAKFNVIEGRGPVYAKILQMMNETKNQLSTITTVTGLLRADQFGLFETGIENQLRPRIVFRAITELSEQNLGITKNLLKGIKTAKVSFEGRTPDLSLNLPQLVIKDEEEILFFITPKMNDSAKEQEDVCLWTNCKSLVQAFTTVFEDFWRNSTNINAKLSELETGKPAPKTQIIEDAETARRKYNEAVKGAEKEIVIITSTQGLNEICENKPLQDTWAQKGVFVRIMAPITSENMKAALQLLRNCDVRHTPLGYLGTTIVDMKQLFQFKNAPLDQQTPESRPSFEKTFYSNDYDYVEKTKSMLDDVWRNAQAPSSQTLEAINRAGAIASALSETAIPKTLKRIYRTNMTVKEENAKQLTEEYLINKMVGAEKSLPSNKPERPVTTYSTNCQALIRPPSQLNLPDILIHVYHMDKASTYGAEDVIAIFPWLNTPAGYAYVPAALITDNPKARNFWKRFLAGTPAENNVRVVEKETLQVRTRGNTLFVGWTEQIPFIQYTLPPSCLLIEGHGNLKTIAYLVTVASGYKMQTEGNLFADAFVTFFHPTSKYSGPGTDGVFGRDVIMEFYPPEDKSTTSK